jgi:DNA-binding winged helix-turn-helix (wHTH) protein
MDAVGRARRQRLSLWPLELDADTRRLFRDGRPVWIPERQMDVLLAPVSHPGQILTKRELTDAAWRDLAVTDNSIVQAVRGLRETLGTQPLGRSTW